MLKKIESMFRKADTSRPSSSVEKTSMSISDLPDDILTQIFVYLTAEDLCKRVVLACKRFKEIVESDSFWTEKLLHDKRANRNLIKILNGTNCYEPKKLYFRNPFDKNLIKNPFGDEGFDDWCILKDIRYHEFEKEVDELIKRDILNHYKQKKVRNSKKKTEMHGFVIESDDHGSKPFVGKNNKQLKKFATTYYLCAKYQLIDLYNEGLWEHIIKQVRPRIEISDNYAARFDCGVEYHIKCALIDSDFKKIDTHSFHDTIAQWSEGDWHEHKHVFEKYPDNLRYILFIHAGKDTQYWDGNYGAKLTNSSVRLLF